MKPVRTLYAGFCWCFFLVFVLAADATVMVLSRKLNIPIKNRENYFRFGKNKKDKK